MSTDWLVLVSALLTVSFNSSIASTGFWGKNVYKVNDLSYSVLKALTTHELAMIIAKPPSVS